MSHPVFRILVIAAVALCFPRVLIAGLPCACGGLDTKALGRAEALMAKIHPHDCCDEDLWTCAQAAAPSRLVMRLAAGLCRRVAERESDAEILREFERRTTSMLGTGSAAKIDTAEVAWAGEAGAPVEVVAYTCARCPFCSKSVPGIHRAVTTGALEGKARLGVRIFPVKGHPHSAEAGVAFQAALQLGRFWPYLLAAYEGFDAFSEGKLSEWASEAGLERSAFEGARKDPKTRRRVVDAKKEGLRNRVKATPTYFINGKLYSADLSDWALSDAVLEEFERVSGTLCEPE
jgi:protein-disulfide isomerase